MRLLIINSLRIKAPALIKGDKWTVGNGNLVERAIIA